MLSQLGKIDCVNLDECANALLEINKSLQQIIKRTSEWQL
jgi:hypothetical protein